jgi:AcrR family transcriptional regulator
MVHLRTVGVAEHAVVPGAGRRERKKQATRAALREAALRLALRHGVENITVEQIADEADIALRTFFNYFSSKEEAVLASAAAGAESLIAEFRARPRAESVLRAFREAVLVVMDRSTDVSRDHLQVLRLIRRAPSLVPHQMVLLAAQEKALAEAIAERVGATATGAPAYPMLCAAAVLAALRVVVDRWIDATARTADLRRQVDTALTELAAGLDRPGAPPG